MSWANGILIKTGAVNSAEQDYPAVLIPNLAPGDQKDVQFLYIPEQRKWEDQSPRMIYVQYELPKVAILDNNYIRGKIFIKK